MNTLTRWEGKWDPFKEMEDFHSRLSSILGRTLADCRFVVKRKQKKALLLPSGPLWSM